MSKKKWKHRKKRARLARALSAKDTHHLLYQGRNWRRGALTELRNHYYCRVEVPRSTLHKNIHLAVNNVPVCKPENAKEALNQLRLLTKYGAISDEDRIEKRLIVLISLFDCVEPETTKALKKQLDVVWDFYSGPSR